MSLSSRIISALLPEGVAWEPGADDDYSRLLDGIAANNEAVYNIIKKIRDIRDPIRTPILSDLELEFGVIPLSTATESERRQRLKQTMFRKSKLPTYEELETELRDAGFDVYVHANSPAVDPAIFIAQAFQMTCGDLLPGGNDAQCGEPEAYCGQVGGYLLVNGNIYDQSPIYSMLCDEPDAQCGEEFAQAGQFEGVLLTPIEYTVPVDAGYWPLIFFVGGQATRDPITGEITDIEIAPVPTERESEFKRIILQYKPLFSWAALVVVWS